MEEIFRKKYFLEIFFHWSIDKLGIVGKLSTLVVHLDISQELKNDSKGRN